MNYKKISNSKIIDEFSVETYFGEQEQKEKPAGNPLEQA
jgi:hypothetical protein